ncbi:hypothetical protein SteCoe_24481 [Stentor coeruleus]|uniref:Uncharacterized protein n=1 Tax=Stentor coeruleus TaxID=5963 RepID=A0A1R2BHD1_9CILI|nr:hypothetical protein SteCoe_24481 [Stentor coeruleus]
MSGRNDPTIFSQSVSRPQGSLALTQGNPFSNNTPSISRIAGSFPATPFQSSTSNPLVPSTNPFTPASSLINNQSSRPPSLGQGITNPFASVNTSNQFPPNTGFVQGSSLSGQNMSNLPNQMRNSQGTFPNAPVNQNVSSGFFANNQPGLGTTQPYNFENNSNFPMNPGLPTTSQPNLTHGSGFTGNNFFTQTSTGNNINPGFNPMSSMGLINPQNSFPPQTGATYFPNWSQAGNYQINPTQAINNLIFEDPFNFRFKPIESLSEPMQLFFQNFQEFCDIKEDALKKSEICVKEINVKANKAYEKSENILRQIRKVLSIQKRFTITMENKKEMQNHIVTYVNDLLKMCKHAERNDPYYTYNSPAEFMVEFIDICDKRLTAIQEQVIEIDEMMRNESNKESFQLLITVIKELHEKFQIIASLAYEVHSRIDGLLLKLSRKHKDINILPTEIPQNNFDRIFEQSLLKENRSPESISQAKISDIITGPYYHR